MQMQTDPGTSAPSSLLRVVLTHPAFFSEADPFASRQLVCDCWRGAACMYVLQWRRRSCPRTKRLESKNETQRSLITRNSFKQLAVAAQGRLRGSHRLSLTVLPVDRARCGHFGLAFGGRPVPPRSPELLRSLRHSYVTVTPQLRHSYVTVTS